MSFLGADNLSLLGGSVAYNVWAAGKISSLGDYGPIMDNALRNISLSLRTKPKAGRANTKDGGVDRSREAVRKWIHRFGSLSLKLLTPKASRRIAVVDETCIGLGRRKA